MKSTIFLALVPLICFFRGSASSQRDVHSPEKSEAVDVGGYSLRILVTGKGTPTVVLESGSGSRIEDSWSKVLPEIAKLNRVVGYNRAGIGESEPGRKPRTAQQIATELHTALKNSGLRPPYVLVGHSIGGPYVRVFAHRYPSEVAGLVLVDPTLELAGTGDPIGWAKVHHPEKYRGLEEKLAKAELSEGMRNWMRIMCAESMRLEEEVLLKAPKGSRDEWARMMEREILGFLEQPALEGLRQMPPVMREEEIESGFATLEQARAAWPLPAVPVILLATSKPRETHSNTGEELALEKARMQARLDAYKGWLRKIPYGKLIVTEKSGHHIPNEEPELVVDAVRQVIAKH
jgi:pimeloyl-ACP methyl ester carboxylesterase